MITKQQLETIRDKAPFISEGFISPSAVFEMGKNERKQYEKNVHIRFKAEAEFKEQNKSPEEKAQEEKERKQKEIKTEILQIESVLNSIKDLKILQSKRDNSYKRLFKEKTLKLNELKERLEVKK